MAEMRPIPGYPNYYADTDGNIWSNRPIGGAKVNKRGIRKLKPRKDRRGYNIAHFGLNKPNLRVHRLVLLTFVGSCPPGMEGCHGPNGKNDNSIANLSWGTKSKNQKEDRIRDGTFLEGEKHPEAKLTDEQVLEIRNLRGKITQREIADRFMISPTAISNIQLGRRRKYLTA